jgi:AcrR family transcriptional regulator
MAYRTTPKMAERKDARRRKLLETAARMFGRHGYHATTVPMIVAESGSSTGSFYFYFRNKEDVFAAALEGLGERIAAALNETIRQVHDPLGQMRAAVMGLVQFLAANPEEARILIVESSGLSERLEQIRRAVIAAHAHAVERALSGLSGSLAPIDPAIVSRCWVGAVYEAAYYWLEQPPDQRAPAEALAREVAEFNLRGIGAQ